MKNIELIDGEQRIDANMHWRETPPLMDRLPIYFPEGVCLNELGGCCAECNQEIDDSNFHLKLSRPIPHVATFDGWGFCRDCNLLTPFSFRVRGDRYLTLEIYDKEKGWKKFVSTRPSTIKKIKNWLTPGVRKPPSSGIIEQLKQVEDNNLAKNILSSGWVNIIDYQLANAGNLDVKLDPSNEDANQLVFLDKSANRITISLNLREEDVWDEIGPFQIMWEEPILEENIESSMKP